MKKMNSRGFTLAELLIVVAIIAVLVAIAIPVFTTQLEKSKEGTDIANLRSAYAAAQVTALTGQYGSSGTLPSSGDNTKLYFDPNKDGSLVPASGGLGIGQGTATDGKSDTTALNDGIIKYKTSDNVKGKKIECSFTAGKLDYVKFEGT